MLWEVTLWAALGVAAAAGVVAAPTPRPMITANAAIARRQKLLDIMSLSFDYAHTPEAPERRLCPPTPHLRIESAVRTW
jgi:hypothetical protein